MRLYSQSTDISVQRPESTQEMELLFSFLSKVINTVTLAKLLKAPLEDLDLAAIKGHVGYYSSIDIVEK